MPLYILLSPIKSATKAFLGSSYICLGEPIEGTVSANNPKGVIPVQIKMCENTGKFIILVEK